LSDSSRDGAVDGRLYERSGGTEDSRQEVEDNVLGKSSSIEIGLGMRSRKLLWNGGKDGIDEGEDGGSQIIRSDGSLCDIEMGELKGSGSNEGGGDLGTMRSGVGRLG